MPTAPHFANNKSPSYHGRFPVAGSHVALNSFVPCTPSACARHCPALGDSLPGRSRRMELEEGSDGGSGRWVGDGCELMDLPFPASNLCSPTSILSIARGYSSQKTQWLAAGEQNISTWLVEWYRCWFHCLHCLAGMWSWSSWSSSLLIMFICIFIINIVNIGTVMIIIITWIQCCFEPQPWAASTRLLRFYDQTPTMKLLWFSVKRC